MFAPARVRRKQGSQNRWVQLTASNLAGPYDKTANGLVTSPFVAKIEHLGGSNRVVDRVDAGIRLS